MNKKIILFGYGYVSQFLAKHLNKLGWIIYCTSRAIPIGHQLRNENIIIINFLDPIIISIIQSSHILLSTIPPDNKIIDPVIFQYRDLISQTKFQWIGYLSSTCVYGNHHGSWVNEETQCKPNNERSKIRLSAEQLWKKLYSNNRLSVNIFRLSGIYGPKRNCLEQIKNGKDYTIIKMNQYFSRIHVEDICMAIISSINSQNTGEIFNVSDDKPAPLHMVYNFAAKLLNKKKLKEIPWEDSKLSDQANAFFRDNKKICSNKIKEKLNIKWIYKDYRTGLLDGCLPYLNKNIL